MKSNFVWFAMMLFFFATSCLQEKQTKNDLAYIDVRKRVPEKEIFLTDIAEVTYLCLNSDDDDYLYKGRIHSITENTIVVCDEVSGSVLFFTKEGNPRSRFNRKGQGPEEYLFPMRVLFDETTDDVFVMDQRDRTQVYSSTGMYKRKLTMPQGAAPVNNIVSYDDSSLFFYDENIVLKRIAADYHKSADSIWFSPFYRISKQDGAVLDYVELQMAPLFLGMITQDGERIPPRGINRIVKSKEGVFVCNPESDTVFLYRKDQPLLPVLYKTPSAASTDPMTYLNNFADEGNYQFMEVYTVAGSEFAAQLPVKYYMRNKNTGEVVQPKIFLPDYKGKEVDFSFRSARREYVNGHVYFELDLIELKQADRDNKLIGELKELVATLNEDEDNNVFMLVDFK